jgi:hypothetical protein
MSLRAALCRTAVLFALLLAAPAFADPAPALERTVEDAAPRVVLAQITAPDLRQRQPGLSRRGEVMWVNHLDLLPGDASVTTSHNAINSGVGGGLAGLVITSSAVGDTAPSGGNKVVWMGLQVPPGFTLIGVRTCYELSSARSFITQTRLAQVQSPPGSASVLMDDGADLNASGPVCADSQNTSIDPTTGAVLLSYRVNFAATSDRIVIRAVGLKLTPRP